MKICDDQNKIAVSKLTNNFDLVKKLQKKYVEPTDNTTNYEILNDIAQAYLYENKNYLALLCYNKSLILNPKQADLLNVIERTLICNIRYRYTEVAPTCKISVIIPTYNRPFELRESIQSVLNQTYNDYEIIVVDDFGEYSAAEVVSEFKSENIRYIRLEKNKGLPGARNAGLKEARGEYIAYLDDDDVYYPNHLKLLADYLDLYPDVDFVYANAFLVNGAIENNKFISQAKTIQFKPSEFDRKRLSHSNYISVLNFMHRRKCFLKADMFNEELPKLEDWELLHRFSGLFKFHQLNDITGEYRIKQDNMSVTGSIEMKFLNGLLADFYGFSNGNAALCNSHFISGSAGNCIRSLREVEREYDTYLHPEGFYSLLIDIVIKHSSNSFLRKFTIDYFEISAKECIAKAFQHRSLVMLSIIIPRFVGRFKRNRFSELR